MTTQTHSATQDQTTLLQKALIANSVFSVASGLLFLLAPGFIGEYFGLTSGTPILIIGIGLLFFAGFVYWVGSKTPVNLNYAMEIVIGDVLWVAGSAVLIFTDVLALTTSGKWAIAIIADIVLLFAIVQFVGIREERK